MKFSHTHLEDKLRSILDNKDSWKYSDKDDRWRFNSACNKSTRVLRQITMMMSLLQKVSWSKVEHFTTLLWPSILQLEGL